MLVLSRNEGERIQVGDDIVITLIRAAYGKARLGIDAPESTVILREELVNRTEPNVHQNDSEPLDC